MKRILVLLAALLPAIGVFGQNFTDVAASMGITQTFGFGELGGGVSFCDFNNDGWDDLTFTSQDGDPLYFYVNNGGTYQAITAPVDNTDETKEVIWVDYDNDGDKDLFVTAHLAENRLYRNDGGLSFTDVTLAAFGEYNTLATQGAVWGDYNRDGWLDLYIANFIYELGPVNDLWLSDGDGTFTNVTDQTVANDGTNPTFDACFIDYDNDGWPDLYTTNDKYGNNNGLYRNNEGTFEDVSGSSGAGISINSMNAGGSDYNNDGFLDLYLSNTPEGNVLLKNNGDGTFSDVTVAAGVGFYRVGWASTFFDFDNDMDKDLYVSCMSDGIPTEPNALYVNQGDGTFTEPLFATQGLGGADIGSSLSHAIGDINNDGHLDIALNQVFVSPFILWRNDETDTNNWLKINLVGVTSNADGIGSRIEVWTDGTQQVRYTHCSMGYLGQNSGYYHFGLGTHTLIDSIIIDWPSGTRDKYMDLTNLNQVAYFTEGNAFLPLTLLSFQASAFQNNIKLEWLTQDEVGTDHFLVERSLDGRDFQSIGRVRAAGNSTARRQYDFVDEFPARGLNYYRLKMVDLDGSFAYSPVRAVQAGGDVKAPFTVVQLPENPVVSGQIQLGLNMEVASTMELNLFSRSGELVARKSQDVAEGSNNLSLAVNALPAGSYFLRVSSGGYEEAYQLIILP